MNDGTPRSSELHKPLFVEEFSPIESFASEQSPPTARQLRRDACVGASGVAEWSLGFALAVEEVWASNQAVFREQTCQTNMRLSAASADLHRRAERSIAAIVDVLTDCVMVLFPSLYQQLGNVESGAAFAELANCLRFEPSIAFHLNQYDLEQVDSEPAISGHDPTTGIRIHTSDILSPGDIQATWESGEACRDTQALRTALIAILRGAAEPRAGARGA